MSGASEETELDPSAAQALEVLQFRLEPTEPGSGLDGPWLSRGERCRIGTHPSNDLVLTDRRVSRFHCELLLGTKGAKVRDLESRNGTVLDGVRVDQAWLRDGSTLRLGGVTLAFKVGEGHHAIPLSKSSSFGSLVGVSVAMRATFASLERAAQSDSSVLIAGETGTGKEEAATALHEEGKRSGKPFMVVDCAALPPNLLESELFGHEKGAFTGAVKKRIGAFEAASGGTVFLDEIGELPLELQPKLLGVLERRVVRAVGSTKDVPVDVRIVAATHRNLQREVNEGTFRSDLYYRLAVIDVRLPPLRERPEDLPLISRKILTSLGADRPTVDAILVPELIQRLQLGAWPGNVRELRNYLEQRLALRDMSDAPLPSQHTRLEEAYDGSEPYEEARRRALAGFERRYIVMLLEKHNDNVSRAAQAAGVSRVYLHQLLRRHGLRGT